MNILFLSQRFLLPMDAGGKIRTGKILEQLVQTDNITLVSNIESPKDEPYLPKIEKFCTTFIPAPWKELRKYSACFFVRLFVQMFSVYPVSVLNGYTKSLRTAVERECAKNSYDIAVCDYAQSALMFRNIRGLPTILFQHNVESMIARRHMEQARKIVPRIFWWLQWKKMFLYEARVCKAFDIVIAVSEKDAETFRTLYGLDNVATIPTGVDVDYFAPIPDIPIEKNTLVFCGSMDWLPNEDAIIFFIKDILPVIKAKMQAVTLTVVGRNPSPSLRKLVRNHPYIKLTGWVEDTRPYIASSTLYVVPIRIGGGTRMKIFEAMAMGKTVISSSIGAEGLPVKNEENIIIEDDPIKFGDKIVYLLNQVEKRDKIGSDAREFVSKKFAWTHVADEFSNICQATIQKSQFLSHNSPE